MKCEKCGESLPNDASVCPKCGQKLNEDVFSVESEWVKDREKAEKRGTKRILSIVTMVVCFGLLTGSYLINLIPDRRSYDDALPPYAAVLGTDGGVSLVGTSGQKIINLSSENEISDLLLNEKEDRLFFIASEKDGTRTLCSRYISNLIYESNVIAKNVDTFLINNLGRIVAYKDIDGRLFYGECDEKSKHVLVSENCSEYYLSHTGKLLVYTAVVDGVTNIYKYDGENTLICGDAELVSVKKDLGRLYYRYAGGLVLYNMNANEKMILAQTCTDILKIYDSESLVYYTVADREKGTKTLMCSKKGKTDVVCESFGELVLVNEGKGAIIFSRFVDNKTVYSMVTGNNVDSLVDFSGFGLTDFTFADNASKVYYIDHLEDQTRLISARVTPEKLDKLSIVDTDVKMICGLIDGKPLYIKNFNPINLTVALYYNVEKVSDRVSVREAGEFDIHIIKPETFEYGEGDEARSYLVTTRLRSSETYLFYDNSGFICTFDGDRVNKVTEANASDLYLISNECILYSTGTGFYIKKKERETEVKVEVENFIFIEPFGNKPYQLADK
jgi:hypothetical protein